MKRLKEIASNIKIGEKGPFKLYALDNFDFSENLDLKENEGVYMFTNRKISENGSIEHEIFYIGRTNNYDKRFYDHYKENPFKRENPNCIAILACSKDHKDRMEKELIQYWKPKYNERL